MNRPPWLDPLPPNPDCPECREFDALCQSCASERRQEAREIAGDARRDQAKDDRAEKRSSIGGSSRE